MRDKMAQKIDYDYVIPGYGKTEQEAIDNASKLLPEGLEPSTMHISDPVKTTSGQYKVEIKYKLPVPEDEKKKVIYTPKTGSEENKVAYTSKTAPEKIKKKSGSFGGADIFASTRSLDDLF
jgi:hypothetical protein